MMCQDVLSLLHDGQAPVTEALVLPSRFDVIRVVRGRLEEQLLAFGYTNAEWLAVRLSVHEALTNAIRHGNQHDAGKSLVVIWSISSAAVRIRISDEGSGFNPDLVPDPTLEATIGLSSGRGLWLMKHYMDVVSFNTRANSVTLIKRRSCDA